MISDGNELLCSVLILYGPSTHFLIILGIQTIIHVGGALICFILINQHSENNSHCLTNTEIMRLDTEYFTLLNFRISFGFTDSNLISVMTAEVMYAVNIVILKYSFFSAKEGCKRSKGTLTT